MDTAGKTSRDKTFSSNDNLSVIHQSTNSVLSPGSTLSSELKTFFIGLVLLTVACEFAVEQTVTRVVVAAIAILTAIYALATVRGHRSGKLRESRSGWLAMAIELTLATCLVGAIQRWEEPHVALEGVGFGSYFFVVGANVLRGNTLQWVVSTALSAVLFFLTTKMGSANPSWASLFERTIWLFAVGSMIRLATDDIRVLASMAGKHSRRKRQLERSLRKYMSASVASQMLTTNIDRPRRAQITVMFCDLRGFTFLCQRERPEDVVEILNRFYEPVCEIVEQHGGTVNKLLGDGMLVMFGAPLPCHNQIEQAARSALEVLDVIRTLRERGGAYSSLAVGIGIDVGEAVVGAIGSNARAEYTAIGSVVNRAARLQGLGNREAQRIVLSQNAKLALPPTFRVGLLGEYLLKGFTSKERAYYLWQNQDFVDENTEHDLTEVDEDTAEMAIN